MRTILDLAVHEEALVVSINEDTMRDKEKYTTGDVESRLLDMGFIEGCMVTLMHRGLFGGEPFAVRINQNSSLISLRKSEASAVFINTKTGELC
jgi:Fe2+ transport system protein FeoA